MPSVKVGYSFDTKRILLPVRFSNPNEPNKSLICPALVDTGATHTCITNKVAYSIGVVSRQDIIVVGVNGEHIAKLYYVDFSMPQTNFSVNRMKVSEFTFGKEIAILGMDILSQGTFTFDSEKNFTFCI